MSADQFTRNLPDSAKEERALIEGAFRVTDALRQKIAEVGRDPELSDIGKKNKVQQEARGGLLQNLKQIRARTASMAADVSNLRTAIKPREPDRSDLFAEMQNAEKRTWLRSLPDAARIRAVLEDQSVAAAVLHSPPALSGLTPEIHERVVQAHVEREFGSQLRGIERKARIMESVKSAVDVATMQYRSAAGLKEEDME